MKNQTIIPGTMRKPMIKKEFLLAPISLVVLVVVFVIASPGYLSAVNLSNLMKQTTINLILATGMTLVILTAGIDLSVGSITAFGMCFMAVLYHNFGLNIWISALGCLVLCLVCGIINGVCICYGKVPPFIATLGMQGIARGLALIITAGYTRQGFPNSLRVIATKSVFGIPVMFLIAIVILAVIAYMLRYTELGRSFYALGGNEEAARYSGIAVERSKMMAYVITAFCCGIAAIILASRLNSATPSGGDGYELDAIAAVVIGGTNLAGGEGHLMGTLIGAFVISVLSNGLTRLNVDSFVQTAIIGVVIILCVLVKTVSEKRN